MRKIPEKLGMACGHGKWTGWNHHFHIVNGHCQRPGLSPGPQAVPESERNIVPMERILASTEVSFEFPKNHYHEGEYKPHTPRLPLRYNRGYPCNLGQSLLEIYPKEMPPEMQSNRG